MVFVDLITKKKKQTSTCGMMSRLRAMRKKQECNQFWETKDHLHDSQSYFQSRKQMLLLIIKKYTDIYPLGWSTRLLLSYLSIQQLFNIWSCSNVFIQIVNRIFNGKESSENVCRKPTCVELKPQFTVLCMFNVWQEPSLLKHPSPPILSCSTSWGVGRKEQLWEQVQIKPGVSRVSRVAVINSDFQITSYWKD